MKKIVWFAVAIVMAGCGQGKGLRSGNTNPATTGDAAAAGTGGVGADGNAGASGAAAGGGTSIAGSIASSSTRDAATGGGGAVSVGGSSESSEGSRGGTTGGDGPPPSGGRLDASGVQSDGGSSASSANAGGTGGRNGTSSNIGGSVDGSAPGSSAGQSGNSGSTGGDTAGAGGSTASAAGNGGTSGTGGAPGSCTGCQSLEQCWNGLLCVAKSVSVPAGFAIDATEVTRSQYTAWLATNPATTGQATVCSWNTSFAPDAACMARTTVCQGAACGNHPQPCIDMCDASAYCNAVGKQLCTGNSWSAACTSSGVNRFTYGNSLATRMCHDSTDSTSSTTTVPVGSMPGCQSLVPGYGGIFDLIGNVSEWEDNCSGAAGATDICQPGGTSFGMSAAMPECKQSIPVQRAGATDKVGFRCCAPGASLID